MTDTPDARVAAWTCAWNAIQAAQELRQPRKDRGPRVAPDPLPELYWAALAEAAVYADLARADLPTGQQAFAMVNAVETAKQATIDTLTDILGVRRPDAGKRDVRDRVAEATERVVAAEAQLAKARRDQASAAKDPVSDAIDEAEHQDECGQECDCHARLNPGFHCSACDPTGNVDAGQGVSITPEGAAVVESGLTLRQAHELKTGCSEANPCDQCRLLMGYPE